jgi:hypothetical protein
VTISTNKINIGIDKTWHTIEFSNNRRTRFQRPNKQPFRSGATFQTYPIRTPEANRLVPIRCPFPTSPPTLTLKQTAQSHRFSSVICGGLLPLVGGNSDYITHLRRPWQIHANPATRNHPQPATTRPLGWAALTLASAEGTEVPLGYPTAAQAAKVSPTRPAWVPQDHLEPLLLGLLRSLPSAEVRFGCELVDAKANHDGVQVSLRMGDSNF